RDRRRAGRRLAPALRPRRLPAGRSGLPAHASRSGHPLPARRLAAGRGGRRKPPVPTGRRLVRERARAGARRRLGDAGDGLRARDARAARARRQAHHPLRRPGRRGQAEAAAGADLPRAADRAVIAGSGAVRGVAVTRSGGRVLVDQLELHGVEIAFCVPGESYLPVLDALHDARIRLISCRHEAAAANMAEAYGKLTGRPGICLVTRGPGSTHASIGVHIAWQDSTPMILLAGQVRRAFVGRDAFQELDYPHVFGGLAKWAVQAEDAGRLPELVARAFAVAVSGRPGPVVLALPEDVLAEEPDAAPIHVPHPQPSEDDLRRLRQLLERSERPLAIVGEGGWTADAAQGVLAF